MFCTDSFQQNLLPLYGLLPGATLVLPSMYWAYVRSWGASMNEWWEWQVQNKNRSSWGNSQGVEDQMSQPHIPGFPGRGHFSLPNPEHLLSPNFHTEEAS